MLYEVITNYSYIVIDVRERVWYENGVCYHKNEQEEVLEVESNPLKFLQKYYKTIDKEFYKQKSQELGIGLRITSYNVCYTKLLRWRFKEKWIFNGWVQKNYWWSNVITSYSIHYTKLYDETVIDTNKEANIDIPNIL